MKRIFIPSVLFLSLIQVSCSPSKSEPTAPIAEQPQADSLPSVANSQDSTYPDQVSLPEVQQDEPSNPPSPTPSRHPFEETLINLGLPTDVEYKYWPLVYFPPENKYQPVHPDQRNKYPNQTTIPITMTKVKNFGNESIGPVQIRFEHYAKYPGGSRQLFQHRQTSLSMIAPGELGFFQINEFHYEPGKWEEPILSATGITGDPRYR